MFVKKLSVLNFRNYKNSEIEFCPTINLISGLNGQGKTNLVEALVFLSLAKSPRTTKDKELILQDQENANIKANVVRSFGEVNLDYNIFKSEDNSYFVNYNKVKKTSQILGNLVSVYFSPQELKIVSGAPSDRRDFCDTDISMLSEAYYNLTLRYEKILAQRNKLLKTERDHSKIIDTIGVWDEQLASVAAPIIKTRKSFILKLAPFANMFLKEVSSQKENLEIVYLGIEGNTTQEIKKNLKKALDFNLSKDMELGYTSIGPHRDDIRFDINGKDARVFSSQGQARSIVLALKLAEMKIMEEELGEKPVMIFDDVFSELDSKRQRKLFECLEDSQAIFTGTTFKYKPKTNYSQITIKEGNIKSIKHVDVENN